MRSLAVVIALLAVSALPLPAQDVVVGNIASQFSTFEPPLTGTSFATVIAFNDPANASGSVNLATVRWGYGSAGACSDAFRVQFYRAIGIGQMSLIAERGPFATTGTSLFSVTLDPPVELQALDLIGIEALRGPACGGVARTYASPDHFYIVTFSDFGGGLVPPDASIRFGLDAGVRASSSQILAGIIPAVGNVAGVGGAAFRTTFQVTNTSEVPLNTTKFVFHPAGTPGSLADPQTSLTLSPHQTVAPDLLSLMGASGLGSLDVYTKGEFAPLVTAHVFNDQGGPTNGFTEAIIPRSAALHTGQFTNIVFPSDLTNYRMNIGVRTLDRPVLIVKDVFGPGGNRVGDPGLAESYPANYFTQVPLATFIAAQGAPQANGYVRIQVLGDVIVYSSLTDNRTNDSAIFVAQVRP
jgi:hypothetical protein